MKKFSFLVTVFLAAVLTVITTGCTAVSQKEQKDIVAFYIGFVKDATSLDSTQINQVYSELKKENFEGQDANTVRDKTFAKFNTINPDLFAEVHMANSSYSEVGKAYSTVLLMSLATEGEGIDVTMPTDAVTSYEDEKIGRVYEIDRKKITATVPESVEAKVTRPNKNGLAPVKLIKDGDSWKVLADNNMLTEIGVPLTEKITAPSSEK